MSQKHVCDIDFTKVIDARPVAEFGKYGRYTRRRVCRKCWDRVSTVEITKAEYEKLTEAREFVSRLATFAEELKHGTDGTTI